jgi:predicted membrane protein
MSSRNIFAVLLILIGIGFLLDSFEYMEFSYTISKWWPLIIIAFGIIHISKKNPPILSGLIIIVIGIILQADKLELISGGFWGAFWPLLLIIIGISIIYPGKKFIHKTHTIKGNNDFDITAFFSGQNKNIDLKNFKSGTISAYFGSAEIDLTKTEISPDDAVLNINTAFGGIELRVPKNWRLSFSGSPIFGGFDDKTSQDVIDDSPTLFINYNVSFGGIEIKN